MGELGFAAAEFAVDFANTRALEATTSPIRILEFYSLLWNDLPSQDGIELFAAGRDFENFLSLMTKFYGSYEAIRSWLG